MAFIDRFVERAVNIPDPVGRREELLLNLIKQYPDGIKEDELCWNYKEVQEICSRLEAENKIIRTFNDRNLIPVGQKEPPKKEEPRPVKREAVEKIPAWETFIDLLIQKTGKTREELYFEAVNNLYISYQDNIPKERDFKSMLRDYEEQLIKEIREFKDEIKRLRLEPQSYRQADSYRPAAESFNSTNPDTRWTQK